MKICLFDPGIGNHNGSPSANLGDLIIQEAVERELSNLFQGSELTRISTHVYPKAQHLEVAKKSDLIFVGGTNLLESKMRGTPQWKVSLKQKLKLGRVILLGVGWQNYQNDPDLYTQISLKAVLSGKMLHSVRDSYTKTKLQNAGIANVINTGCPTMWPFIDFKSEGIPKEPAEIALLMLTDYSKNPEADRKLIDLALSKYKKVFVWPQGKGDAGYVVDLMTDKDFPIPIIGEGAFHRISNLSDLADSPLILLGHSMPVFKSFIGSAMRFDYIGTRLHGGIKCLLSGRRSLILEIDNRAKEIARETNLPTTERENFDYIDNWMKGGFTTAINVNPDPINRWRSQFSQFKMHLKAVA
jgi:polysaccharide pyruvyl transferase WcaK-like protein